MVRGPADGQVRVEPREDGRWRWTWDDGDGAPPLVSNESFGSDQEALEAAREAFPRAAVETVRDPKAPARARRRSRLALFLGAVLTVLVVKAAARARRR